MLSVIASAILLVLTVTVSGFLERTELRRELHAYYDADGAFDAEYKNVDADTVSLIEQSGAVEAVGKTDCIGHMQQGDFSATAGSFRDASAEQLAHYPLADGRLPQTKGEAAVTRDVLQIVAPLAKVGDEIELPIIALNETEPRTLRVQLVGIFAEFGRDTFESPVYGTEFCDPRIILSAEETDAFPERYTNLMFQFFRGEQMALAENEKLFAEESDLLHACFQRGYSRVGTGRSRGIQLTAMARGDQTIDTAPKLKMVRLITVCSVIVSAISMLSALTVVLQNRLRSFQLMRCIGYSKVRLVRLLLTEMAVFFVMSAMIGAGLGILLYEGILLAQGRWFELHAYKGYFTEWVVAQRTIPPLQFALTAEFLTYIAAYAVILAVLLFRLKTAESPIKHSTHRVIRSVYGGIDRVLSQKGIMALQVISLSSVIVIGVAGYLYCTPVGKGESVVSQTSMQTARKGTYEVLDGLDLKAEQFDALIEARNPFVAAKYLTPAGDSGISQTDLDAMQQTGIQRALCWSERSDLVLELNGQANETVLANAVSDDDCARLGAQPQTLAALPCILVNDAMLDEFASVSGSSVRPGGAVWVSVYGDGSEFAADEVFRVHSFRADSTGYQTAESVTAEFQVAQCVRLSSTEIEESSILRHVVNDLGNYPGFLLLNGKYAAQLGLFGDSYNKALVDGNSDENVIRAAAAGIRAESGTVQCTTVFEMKRQAVFSFVFNYLSIILLLVLLFAVFLIGFGNVLRLSLRMKSQSFAVMRCVGLEQRRLTRSVLRSNMKIPVISAAVSGIAVFGSRMLLKSKYEMYCDLVTQRDQLYSANASGEEVSVIAAQLRTLRNRFMLGEEMWVPDWRPVFVLLACLIAVFSILTVCMILKTQYVRNLKDTLSEMNRE